jgi:RNA polymerase sigma-70 factor (ECF subfamily)
LANSVEIEDAVQQIVISLHKGLPNLKSPYAFHSYLYRVTSNVCSKFNQREASRRYTTLEELEFELVDEKSTPPPLALEQKDDDELVRYFISRLPEKQRYTLLLYYYYDLPYKEIAEALDTSVTVVGSNISRAKKNLKRMLEEHENNQAKAQESELSHKGVAVDAMFVAAFVSGTEKAIGPAHANILWQKCVELAPQLAAGASTGPFAVNAIIAGVVAMVMVAGGVALVLNRPQDVAEPPPPIVEQLAQEEVVQLLPFIPDYVSINMESSLPYYPETCNPQSASIELSEGFGVSWLIRSQSGSVLAEGTSQTIDREIFLLLDLGTYSIEWTVSNDEGSTGTAHREFIIIDESALP